MAGPPLTLLDLGYSPKLVEQGACGLRPGTRRLTMACDLIRPPPPRVVEVMRVRLVIRIDSTDLILNGAIMVRMARPGRSTASLRRKTATERLVQRPAALRLRCAGSRRHFEVSRITARSSPRWNV